MVWTTLGSRTARDQIRSDQNSLKLCRGFFEPFYRCSCKFFSSWKNFLAITIAETVCEFSLCIILLTRSARVNLRLLAVVVSETKPHACRLRGYQPCVTYGINILSLARLRFTGRKQTWLRDAATASYF